MTPSPQEVANLLLIKESIESVARMERNLKSAEEIQLSVLIRIMNQEYTRTIWVREQLGFLRTLIRDNLTGTNVPEYWDTLYHKAVFFQEYLRTVLEHIKEIRSFIRGDEVRFYQPLLYSERSGSDFCSYMCRRALEFNDALILYNGEMEHLVDRKGLRNKREIFSSMLSLRRALRPIDIPRLISWMRSFDRVTHEICGELPDGAAPAAGGFQPAGPSP